MLKTQFTALVLCLASTNLFAQSCGQTQEKEETVIHEVQVLHQLPPEVPEYSVFAGEQLEFDTDFLRERMDRELIAFTYTHSTSTLMLKRAGKYFPIVEPILKEYGIPDDFKYLMVIESNLDPKAYSSAGAAGLWQFTKASAKTYGLEIREGVDERYNIEKETRAACKFLKQSYAKFGNWLTVAASYNAGIGGISKRASEQHQSLAVDMWLPEETTRYIFRLHACKMMFENPKAFGFDISEEDRYPYVKPRRTVKVSDAIPSLVDFAESQGVTYAQLKAANLWLRDSKLDNKEHREYEIIIP